MDQPQQVKEIYAVYEKKIEELLANISEKLAEIEASKNDQDLSHRYNYQQHGENTGLSYEDL